MGAVPMLESQTTGIINAGTTTMAALGEGSGGGLAIESQTQVIYRTAGAFNNLYVRISTNGITGGASTVVTRKGGVSQNLTVSIAASTTGEFEDLTNSDTVVSGDLWNFSITAHATGTSILVVQLGVTFSATTNTTKKHNNAGLWASSGSIFYPISGLLGGGIVTTEANAQYPVRLGGTWSNLSVLCTGTFAAITTYRNRINGANGNMVVSVAASTTGRFEDLVNSNTLTSGMLINCSRA